MHCSRISTIFEWFSQLALLSEIGFFILLQLKPFKYAIVKPIRHCKELPEPLSCVTYCCFFSSRFHLPPLKWLSPHFPFKLPLPMSLFVSFIFFHSPYVLCSSCKLPPFPEPSFFPKVSRIKMTQFVFLATEED